ncbi:EndoU domain-containing protein [Ureibacillus sp. Re31]|uniref:EndoU domain-containing protein n=1 Tax=Ureibacillus galli TaxID=2762222 RepID=A0ABR8X906_9BACL|nr:CdiA family toxin C-terminal domain-containing protein [Ureibacillus galli]MBD8025678.1 EndoU domain-containing protein [Ureibacillus galli]
MSKIKVDIDRVNDLTPSFSQVTTKVSNTTDKVASIRSQIDYRIKARHGIGDQLYKISNELQTIEKNMQKLVSFLQNSMDKYAEAEEKIAKQVPELPNVIGKNNITIDANGKIQVMDEYAQFNTNRAIDPNTGEYLFTFEGKRQVLGGNGSGTPDAIPQFVNSVDDLLYEIFLSDIVTLFDPSASDSERAIARASMTPLGKAIKVIKGAKVATDVLDNSKDIAKTVDKAENIKDLSKSIDKTKDIQDKTISDLEVKQLGEYIKDLEKKQVDKGAGKDITFKSGYDQHLKEVEAVVRKKNKGIVGGHNLNEFEKVFIDNGWDIQDCIISRKKHSKIDGIYEIEYGLPAIDREGRIIPGELKKVRTPKTVYDPELISDDQMLKWGEEAMKNGEVVGRKITGTSQNGLKFEGYIDETTGEVTNFFPTLNN